MVNCPCLVYHSVLFPDNRFQEVLCSPFLMCLPWLEAVLSRGDGGFQSRCLSVVGGGVLKLLTI